jgi:hypothetical protein
MLTLQFKIEASTTTSNTTGSSTIRTAQACLEPFTAAAAAATAAATKQHHQQPPAGSSSTNNKYYQQDEKVLVALQHSLFCAKLFESIRRELAADTEVLGTTTTTTTTTNMSSSSYIGSTTTAHDSRSLAVWLSSDGQGTTNFLPAPHLMIRGSGGGANHDDDDDDDDDDVFGASITKASQPLAVIHCHEVRQVER